MGKVAGAVLAGLVACTAPQARAGDPVAFVSDLRGDVILDGKGRPPLLAELLPGSRLDLGAGASAAVMYVVSGEEYGLKGPGEFIVARDTVRNEKGATPARRTMTQRVAPAVVIEASRSATASLRMRSVHVPGRDTSRLLYPVNARIATLQPTLRWSGDPEIAYAVAVIAAAGAEVFRGPAMGLSLHLPVRLVAGQRYSWRVLAKESVLGESRFETLPPATIAAAERARAGAKTFSDRVLHALVLEDLGAPQDSREAWGRLAAERPDLPELSGMAR